MKIEKDFVEEDGYDKHHYIYLCQKLEGADEISQKYFNKTIEDLVKQQMEEEEDIQEENEKEENKEIEQVMENNGQITDNIFVQNENDNRQTNMGTNVKMDISKKDKIKVEDTKVISDVI